MILAMEGFYHIHALLALQYVKLIYNYFIFVTTLKIKAKIHAHTHAIGKQVGHIFNICLY